MELLAQWMCRAGRERAIDLLGAPSPLCARCTGFYLALALGLWLHRFTGARRIGALPLVLLASACALTLVQVAHESSTGIASAPGLRLALGVAVGLPLGWIAGARLSTRARRPIALAACVSLVLAALAFVTIAPVLLELAVAIDISLALVIVALALASGLRRHGERPQ